MLRTLLVLLLISFSSACLALPVYAVSAIAQRDSGSDHDRDRDRDVDPSDTYPKDVSAPSKPYNGCGKSFFTLEALHLGSNSFAPYSLATDTGTEEYVIPCNEVPAKDDYPASMGDGVREFQRTRHGVAVFHGKTKVAVAPDDNHTYQYAYLSFYSPRHDIRAPGHFCNLTDDTVVCEAMSKHDNLNANARTALLYNRLAHWIARAEFHRKTGEVDRCQALLQKATRESKDLFSLVEKSKSGDLYEGVKYGWYNGVKYRTWDDRILMEAELFSEARAFGDKASELASSGDCSKAAAASAFPAPQPGVLGSPSESTTMPSPPRPPTTRSPPPRPPR